MRVEELKAILKELYPNEPNVENVAGGHKLFQHMIGLTKKWHDEIEAGGIGGLFADLADVMDAAKPTGNASVSL